MTDIQTGMLTQAIRQHYGIQAASLRFLQRGWGGDCFAIDTAAADRYFLKVHDGEESFDTAASSKAFYLPLLHQLHAKGILNNIPHLVPTLRGEFSCQLGALELVVTHFIKARLVGFGVLAEPILSQLSRLVGILHGSLPQLNFEQPFIERFEIIPNADFEAVFNTLESIKPSDRTGRWELRNVLTPYREEILAALERQRVLQAAVRLSSRSMVVCHTDLHGGNLMQADGGDLYILDWENALIAPPEHDMIFFAGEPDFWEIFWPNYKIGFPEASLDPRVLRFYYYRRSLEDILGFAWRILYGDGKEQRDRQDLGYLQGNLHGLGTIDQTIETIVAGGVRSGFL